MGQTLHIATGEGKCRFLCRYVILYKGLEHPRILSAGRCVCVLQPIHHGYRGTTVYFYDHVCLYMHGCLYLCLSVSLCLCILVCVCVCVIIHSSFPFHFTPKEFWVGMGCFWRGPFHLLSCLDGQILSTNPRLLIPLGHVLQHRGQSPTAASW